MEQRVAGLVAASSWVNKVLVPGTVRAAHQRAMHVHVRGDRHVRETCRFPPPRNAVQRSRLFGSVSRTRIPVPLRATAARRHGLGSRVSWWVVPLPPTYAAPGIFTGAGHGWDTSGTSRRVACSAGGRVPVDRAPHRRFDNRLGT